jgi:hypothetical protein
MRVKNILIHPSNTVASAAALTYEVEAMRVAELRKLVKQLREFFINVESLNLRDL